MADDKYTDSPDESDESTPLEPAEQNEEIEAAELSENDEIVDPLDTPDDAYVDDPATDDVNEAKLERATDDVTPGLSRRRKRSSAPVRRTPVAEEEPAEETEAKDAKASTEVAKKERATRSRKEAQKAKQATEKRTTPGTFINEAVGELRKVVWPTGNQVQQYFIVVLVFVLFIITFVSLLDLGLGWLVLKVFG